MRAEYKSNFKVELQTTHLVAMRRLYWQKNVGRVVQLWKDRIRNQDHESIDSAINGIEVETRQFDSKVVQIRVVNQR